MSADADAHPVVPADNVSRQSVKNACVLVIGDLMLDRYWFGDAHRVSPEAPVPVVCVEKAEERLGGAANVARNAARLGGKVALLGVVGDDEPGRTIERLLGEEGVQAELLRDPSLDTTIKLRVLARQQQMLRIDFEAPPPPAALQFKQQVFERLLPQNDIVLLSDYGKGGLAHVTKMIDAARAAGKTVLVDPKGDDYVRYRGASILTPNRAELRQVVGAWRDEADLTHRAQTLRTTLQIEALLLTRSEEGMTLFTDDGVVHEPAQALEVYDVSGAGDTVIATLAVMLGAGLSLREAMRLANRAGGIVVGKLGTATVTWEELFGASSA